METPKHRTLGIATALGLAHVHHLPAAGIVATVASAAVCSGGITSCDLDNSRLWKAMDRWLPDEWLGGGGPLAHRGLLHWWGFPLAMLLVSAHLTGLSSWIVLGAGYGWASHLLGDLVFGQEGYGHGKGIPLLGWYMHVGVGLKADGWPEKMAGLAAGMAAAWFGLGLLLPLPYEPHPVGWLPWT